MFVMLYLLCYVVMLYLAAAPSLAAGRRAFQFEFTKWRQNNRQMDIQTRAIGVDSPKITAKFENGAFK